jgi:hypothetical protein
MLVVLFARGLENWSGTVCRVDSVNIPAVTQAATIKETVAAVPLLTSMVQLVGPPPFWIKHARTQHGRSRAMANSSSSEVQ